MSLTDLIDTARVLHPGDVVAIRMRRMPSAQARILMGKQLAAIHKETGVHFVLFEDVDLEVFRPVDP